MIPPVIIMSRLISWLFREFFWNVEKEKVYYRLNKTLYENLIEVTNDKTVIYISHRLSSAVLSDKIIVLKDGEIIQSGSHSELMAQGGEYENMFELQASSYNAEEG